jgi:4-amino-4-deoxy-L-arabinose transferase-like glycosyltransferase
VKGLPDLLGRPAFLGFVLLFFFTTHLYRITDPPNGYHRWRETDTAAVARNFATESWNPLRPRIDVRGTGDGVVGTEFPAYTWTVAAASTLGWDIHGWGRLLTVLGACAALLGFHRVVRGFTGQNDLAGLATFLAASVPLLAFYGRTIQPDVWALAFATNALAVFLKWTKGGHASLAAAAATLTALAGSIKPTYLAIGLPMLVALWKQEGAGLFKQPRTWLFAAGALLPVWIWFQWARGLDPGNHYFLSGGNWEAGGQAILGGEFYRNVYRVRFLELIVGTPVVWAFVVGLVMLRKLPNAGILVAWIIGVFSTYFLTATYCATAHDYHTMTAVFPLAVVTALGLRATLTHSSRTLRVFAIITMLAMPVYGFGRIAHRYGEPYDFWAGRVRSSLHLPAGALVVAIDPMPGFVLYYSGRKGWRLPPGGDALELERAASQGARYVLVERSQLSNLVPCRRLIGDELYSDEWLTAYELQGDDDRAERTR